MSREATSADRFQELLTRLYSRGRGERRRNVSLKKPIDISIDVHGEMTFLRIVRTSKFVSGDSQDFVIQPTSI